ncbi:DUF2786 domain-containing protein [Nocardia sp. ET3-3]|uniref:DUF2786 domain-containing protein n=1 Tax=Nocardia terrae TaxID=2675851 RepID=A0A7K1UQX9_9NOCA|nr:DUF2786 domain-containing protein [Nocardia terrae]MVU76760.1 DUF2786 domain-containing protein [Nocardia terrae]
MGKNRRHRAAAQRARQERDSGGGFDSVRAALGEGDANPEQIGYAILTGALEAAKGDARAVRRFAAALAGDGFTPALESGAYLAGRQAITTAFESGWLPADIHQAARRRVGEFAVAYLIDLMAAYMGQFAADTVDETWRAQLDELGAKIWWAQANPHLAQWAGKQLLIAEEAVSAVIEALALLFQLPRMELIRPLPGTARPARTAHHAVDEKALGRIRGLLAKAESTSFPEEAEVLSAKAQELMTKYAIDRVLLEADAAAPDLPAARRLWLDTPYVDAKALLVDAVANANRCRAIFSAEWGFVSLVGDEADLDAAELLTTSLLVQATRAMIATGDARDSARTRPFRKSFLIAYATRIGERLTRANAETIAKAPEPERLLPVLASHQLRVDTAVDTYFPSVKTSRISVPDAEGWHAGRAAADRAHLDS